MQVMVAGPLSLASSDLRLILESSHRLNAPLPPVSGAALSDHFQTLSLCPSISVMSQWQWGCLHSWSQRIHEVIHVWLLAEYLAYSYCAANTDHHFYYDVIANHPSRTLEMIFFWNCSDDQSGRNEN